MDLSGSVEKELYRVEEAQDIHYLMPFSSVCHQQMVDQAEMILFYEVEGLFLKTMK
jgi:hypothetical protein